MKERPTGKFPNPTRPERPPRAPRRPARALRSPAATAGPGGPAGLGPAHAATCPLAAVWPIAHELIVHDRGSSGP